VQDGVRTEGEFRIANRNRTVGGLLSHAVTRAHGAQGLPHGTIRFALRGSAGQSFGAWLAPGIELTLIGQADDYVGKGLSGGVRGPTGRNFAAGMSGGIAYVFDENGTFAERCNTELVGLESLEFDDLRSLRELIGEHERRTESPVAGRILDDWQTAQLRFVKL